MNLNIIYRLYKLERKLYLLKIPVIPIIIYVFMRIFLGAVVPYKTKIGNNAVFGHSGLGLVLHPDAVIGDNAYIMHNVTIGGRGKAQVPIIGNNVFIGTGAIVLGDITIGDDVVIGANAVVIKSVPDNCVMAGVPARQVKTSDQCESINYNGMLPGRKK